MSRREVRSPAQAATVAGASGASHVRHPRRAGYGASRVGFSAIEWTALMTLFLLCAVAPAWPSLAALPVLVLALFNLKTPNLLGLPALLGVGLALAGAASAFSNGQVGLAIQLVVSLSVFLVARASARTSAERLSGALVALFVAGAIASASFIVLSEPVVRDVDGLAVVENEGVRLGFPVLGMASVNHVSYAIALGVASWVAWLSVRKQSRFGWLWIPVLAVPVLGVWAILLTGTRGSLVAVVLACLAALVGRERGFGLRGVAVAGLLTMCAVSLVGLLEWLVVKTGFESLFTRDTGDLSGRLYIWETARDLALQRPLFGFGVGGDELWAQGLGAHNTFLAIWLGLGLFGLVLYLSWVISCVGVRRPLGNDSEATAMVPALLLIALLPIWASSVFEWAAIAWGALGVASAASRLTTSRPSEEGA